jgi:hypothetical protein
VAYEGVINVVPLLVGATITGVEVDNGAGGLALAIDICTLAVDHELLGTKGELLGSRAIASVGVDDGEVGLVVLEVVHAVPG